MSLRLGFDMDGVLADLNAALVREAMRLFPGIERKAPTTPGSPTGGPLTDAAAPADPAEVVPGSLKLSSRQERQLWDAVRQITNFWETLAETEAGIVERLATTSSEKRWEVMFLTSRPRTAGDIVQIQSQRWLQQHGFPFPALYVVSTSRGRIAQALELDVVVDDRPENCLDVAIESKARAILVWRGEEGEVPASARRLGIGGVASVGACLDLLVEADAADQAEGGLVDRLKRLLKIKPSTSTQQARA
jgi:hypothetical protein